MTDDLDSEKKGDVIIAQTNLFSLAALQRVVFDVDCYAGCVLLSRPSAKAGAIPADLLPFLSAKVE